MSTLPLSFSPEEYRKEAYYTYSTNCVAFMGYTLLVWDHLISFGDEVEYIWKRPKSPGAYLFFVNRYFTPIAFIGNLVAYFSEWSNEVGKTCHRFVRYEGSCTIIALEVAALLMLLRVWALYKGHNWIIGSVIVLLLIETGVFAWLMTRSVAVEHDTPVRPCTMIFDPRLGGWPSLSAWLPLTYDTYVMVLTLYRCMPRVRKSSAGYIFSTLVKDGLLYYSVIFLVNFILAIMIVAAPPPIKNITAQLEQMFTVAMISRITLSLRRSAMQHSLGLVTAHDNAYRYELDGWRATKHDSLQFRRSSTMLHHISVVPGSYTESPFSSHCGCAYTGSECDKKECVESRRHSANLGLGSFGLLSPTHTYEAASPLSSSVGTVGILGTSPDERVAVIADPSRLNDQNTYELRVMRPSHNPSSPHHLRL